MNKRTIIGASLLVLLGWGLLNAEVGISRVGKLVYQPRHLLSGDLYAEVDGYKLILYSSLNQQEVRRFPIQGNGFYFSREGYVISVQSAAGAPVSILRLYDLEGQQLWETQFESIVNPQMASDGKTFGFLCRNEITTISLPLGEMEHYPFSKRFQLGDEGKMYILFDDYIYIYENSLLVNSIHININNFVKCFYDKKQGNMYIITKHKLMYIDEESFELVGLFYSPERIRDLLVVEDTIYLGIRCQEEGYYHGKMIKLSTSGDIIGEEIGKHRQKVYAQADLEGERYPWPLEPFEGPQEIGNSYGAIQTFTYEFPYLHPGIDIMGVPHQPIYSVDKGIVKAVLTISAELHWRTLISDTATTETDLGLLYAHFIDSTIAVDDEDTVEVGQFLGEMVDYHGFVHLHFARVQNLSTDWYHRWWLTIINPTHLIRNHEESYPPELLPVFDGELLAFTPNQVNNVYLSPDSLYGNVDIIAQTSDYYNGTEHIIDPYRITYSIYSCVDSEYIIENKLACLANQQIDKYFGYENLEKCITLYKQDSVLYSSYPDPTRYYHIITNSDGDSLVEIADRSYCWDTGRYPDGEYIISVTLSDISGNEDTDTMRVSVKNDTYISESNPQPESYGLHVYPTPFNSVLNINLNLTNESKIDMKIVNLHGDIIKSWHSNALEKGKHQFRWDGKNNRGIAVASGIYLVKYDLNNTPKETHRIILCR